MNVFDILIRNGKEKSLTANQVIQIAGGDIRYILYEELQRYDDLDDVLKGDAGIIILYQISKYSGHWTCILKKGYEIEFFDPYSFKPDDELVYCQYDRSLNKKLLLNLLQAEQRNGNKVIYNSFKFQKQGKNIETCGRFVGLRLAFRNLTLNNFINLFRDSRTDYDRLATIMTMSQTQ